MGRSRLGKNGDGQGGSPLLARLQDSQAAGNAALVEIDRIGNAGVRLDANRLAMWWHKKHQVAEMRFGLDADGEVPSAVAEQDDQRSVFRGREESEGIIPGRERAGWLAPVRSRAYLQAGFTPPQGDLPRGKLKPLGRFGVLICYEAMLSVPAARLAAMEAEALVVVSNEGAFDGTLLKRRRLRQDRLRAVETGLWVVRTTETGPSGSVDPRGHPAFLSKEGEQGTWLIPFSYSRSQTPYVALIRALTGGGAR